MIEKEHKDSPTVGVKSNLSVQNQNIQIRRVKIEFVADEKLAQKIERAKAILRHKYPKARLEDIFDENFHTYNHYRAQQTFGQPVSLPFYI